MVSASNRRLHTLAFCVSMFGTERFSETSSLQQKRLILYKMMNISELKIKKRFEWASNSYRGGGSVGVVVERESIPEIVLRND